MLPKGHACWFPTRVPMGFLSLGGIKTLRGPLTQIFCFPYFLHISFDSSGILRRPLTYHFQQVSMSLSYSGSTSSSSSVSQFFKVFTFGKQGFRSVSFPIHPRLERENRVAALSYKNSLSPECVRTLAARYFVPPK